MSIIFPFVNLGKYQYEYVRLHVHYNNKVNIQNNDFLACYSIEILYKVTPSKILPSIYSHQQYDSYNETLER
jgi:hypothetical protein